MGSHSLVLAAVLLFATTATLTGALSQPRTSIIRPPRPPGIRPPRFHSFCHCPRGFVPRYAWPYCKCYKFVRDLASWAEAKVYCGVMRARMVEVRDYSTHSFLRWQLMIRRMRNHHHLLEKQEYWLGATDLQVEGRFRWDTSFVPVTKPTFWMIGNGVPTQEPNNYLGYQNCMAIKRRPYTNINSYYYDWIDDDCYQKKFYICERRGYFCWDWSCWHQLRRYKGVKVDLPAGMTAAKVAAGEAEMKRKAAAKPVEE